MVFTGNPDQYWEVVNNQGRNILQSFNCELTTELQFYFSLAVYSNGNVNLATCIQNNVEYIMVTNEDNKYYCLSLDTTQDFEGYPVFKLVELNPSVVLTYFTLRNPKQYNDNVFVISRTDSAVFYSTMLNFGRNVNTPEGVKFHQLKIPCGDNQFTDSIVVKCPCTTGYDCQSNGDCFNKECAGKPCGGNCSGNCSNGGDCRQDSSGIWDCVLDCTGKPCGLGCYGPSETESCIELGETGQFTRGDPCAAGVCGGECFGTCQSETQTCIKDAAGEYFCKESCLGQCAGECKGDCPEGKTCLQDQNGNYSCQDIVPEPPKVPVWKLWWFWLALIAGIVVILVLGYFVYKKTRPPPKKSTITVTYKSPTVTSPVK